MALTKKDFSVYMAEILTKKRPGHMPAFLFKLIIGKDLYDVISMNCRVSNAKAKKILGWKPQYPSYKEGLIETIRQIKGIKSN